ncbi:MAG TPA: ATP-binding protein [Burkholderiaceae bacterium]|nr:ATP-binding protein [Burkholderiaceae bacterium]
MQSDKDGNPIAWRLEVTPEAVVRWLVRLWWTTAAIDGGVILASFVFDASTFPLRRVAPLVAAAALANAELAWHQRNHARSRMVAGATLLLDVVLLTGLLELSGGPSNPFSVVYAILVALAATTLGMAWGISTAVCSIVCYGVLISWHLHEVVPAHHRFVDFPTHLFAMWLAVATLAELALHFAGAAARAIAAQERQLDTMRRQTARAEHVMSLTTLAAGAAHELSTPLATIAIASKELERALSRLTVPAVCAADARLIREEVDRCQLILDQMSGRAGGSAAEQPESVAVDTVIADLKSRLPADLAARLQTPHAVDVPPVVIARTGLVQVLLSLIKNAFDATDGSKPVTLAVEHHSGMLRFVVQDDGRGMSPETLLRAGEPFYTTKDAGRGFGLGLFLARMFAERCGGSLSLRSDRGTTAVLDIPASPTQVEG